MGSLSDRLRGIVKGSVPSVSPEALKASVLDSGPDSVPGSRFPVPASIDLTEAANVLGGTLLERENGAAILVDREYRAGMMHGGQRIGDIVSIIRDSGTSPLGVPESEDGELLFFDLETTGLAGGAGTQA